MSNSYFQFKQFRINQDKCGMKMSTDACIQGAWTPIADNVKNVLDIGTGTGLLSLMLAQRNTDIIIDAIELDKAAAIQAGQNVAASPWSSRINIICGDVRHHAFDKKYDLIICNPPFFQNSLKGNNTGRNEARHNLSLTFLDLLKIMQANLSVGGCMCILLPAHEHLLWEDLLNENNVHILHKLQIHPYSGVANRIVSICGFEPATLHKEELTIYESKQMYTSAFAKMLQPFYLNV